MNTFTKQHLKSNKLKTVKGKCKIERRQFNTIFKLALYFQSCSEF